MDRKFWNSKPSVVIPFEAVSSDTEKENINPELHENQQNVYLLGGNVIQNVCEQFGRLDVKESKFLVKSSWPKGPHLNLRIAHSVPECGFEGLK